MQPKINSLNNKWFAFLTLVLLANSSLVAQQNAVLYMPLGDSYTIGEGLPPGDRFPNQVVELLKSKKINITLGPNPANTGWTCKQLIDIELPLFRGTKPTIATLLIGVNDWVQGVSPEDFAEQFEYILKSMVEILPSNKHLVVLTIPDFSATPEGKKYGKGRDISAGIAAFNTRIKTKCEKFNVQVIDIYPLTQQMANNPKLIALDGLHPSRIEYSLWAKKVAKSMEIILKNYNGSN